MKPGRVVKGRLHQGADGLWRSRQDVNREIRKVTAAAREEWARTHPVEALGASFREVLGLVKRLDPKAAAELEPLVAKAGF